MPIKAGVLFCAAWLSSFPALAAAGGSAAVAPTQARGGGNSRVVLPVLPVSQSLPMPIGTSLPGLNGLITIMPAPGLGFRSESPVPMLPRSHIPAVQPTAAHEAAAFLEALGPELAGPGDHLSPMQRQAALLGAKQAAVSQEIKAAADQPSPSAEASGDLGQRLMGLLMGRSAAGSQEGRLVPDAPLTRYGVGPAVFAGRTLSLPGNIPADGGLSAAAGAAETQQSLRFDETTGLAAGLIGVAPASFGSLVEASHVSPLPISLITLKVYRHALVLSYVSVPGRMARFSGSMAGRVSRSWLGSSSGSSSYENRPGLTMPAYTADSEFSQSPVLGSLTGAVAETSAEVEGFSFLQEAGERLAAQTEPDPVSAPSSWKTETPGQPSLPSSAPFLVVSFLPILGMALLARGWGNI